MENDRILYVRVTGLFGLFDHRVPFDNTNGLTIVIGDNGVGKTILLKMIHGVMNGRLDTLEKIPFESFQIKFSSGDEIILNKSMSENKTSILHYKASLADMGDATNGQIRFGVNSEKLTEIGSRLNTQWVYNDDGLFEDQADGEILSRVEFLRRVSRHFSSGSPEVLRAYLEEATPKPLFDLLKSKCAVRFIGTDRLSQAISEGEFVEYRSQTQLHLLTRRARRNDLELAVEFYSNDVATKMKAIGLTHSREAEKLHSSLIDRLVNDGSNHLTEKPNEAATANLIARLDQIETRRADLIELDLLRADDSQLVKSSMQTETLDRLKMTISNNYNLFQLYVEDRERTLKIFDAFRARLDLFKQRINERFLLKTVSVNSDTGFRILLDNGQRISPKDLSSGEQHQLVMLYELFFRSQPGELLLIDEPEISLHLAWKKTFVDDMKTIIENSGVEVLIATHSAAVVESYKNSLIRLRPNR